MPETPVCPFCKDPVASQEPKVCGDCGAAHHPDCWECTGACSACGPHEEAVGDNDPVSRPMPGFGSHDIILGGYGGSTPMPTATGDPSAGMVVEEEMGEVLLRLERKENASLLVTLMICGPPLLLVPCVAFGLGEEYARYLPWATSTTSFNAGLMVVIIGCLLAVGYVVRSFYEGSQVTFTDRGVVIKRAVAADFVSWEEVEGYQVEARGHVLLRCKRGQVGVPTPDEESRGKVIHLLDERAVPRFSRVSERKKKTWELVLVLLVGCAVLVIVGVVMSAPPLHAHGRRCRDTAALGALKTIGAAQSLFREADKEADGNLDYGTLSELATTPRMGLIDRVLGSGTKDGYLFEATYGATTSEFIWIATARPANPGCGRFLMTNQSGVIFYTSAGPFQLNNVDCSIPPGANPVGR